MEVGLDVPRGDYHAPRVDDLGLGSDGPPGLLAEVGYAALDDGDVPPVQLAGVDVRYRAAAHHEVRRTPAARRLHKPLMFLFVRLHGL